MTEQTSAVRPAAAGPAGGAAAKLPPVTAIVPCYNAAATLERAAASILDGAPDNLQLILVDDGSADETPRPLRQTGGGGTGASGHPPEKRAGLPPPAMPGWTPRRGEWCCLWTPTTRCCPGLWDALPRSVCRGPAANPVWHGAAERPRALPVGPGFLPHPRRPGDALRPLLFESGYLAAPYPKLFRLPALRAAGLRFDEGLKINEDVLFNTVFLQNSISIFCLSGVYYYQYDGQTGSLSRRLRGDLLDAEAYTAPRAGSHAAPLGL